MEGSEQWQEELSMALSAKPNSL